MNLKKLESATKAFERIKALDKEIIELDKMAILIAGGDSKQLFELTVENKGKDQKQNVLDADGNLINGSTNDMYEHFRAQMHRSMMHTFVLPFGGICDAGKSVQSNSVKIELSDTAALQILGVLLGEKQNERAQLIDMIKSYGICV